MRWCGPKHLRKFITVTLIEEFVLNLDRRLFVYPIGIHKVLKTLEKTMVSLTGCLVQDALKFCPLILDTLPLQHRPQIIYREADHVCLHQVQHPEYLPGGLKRRATEMK